MHSSPIIVFGPPGCGKTTNRQVLMEKYNCTQVIEDWDKDDNVLDNTLILTDMNPPFIYPSIEFKIAMEGLWRRTNA